MEVPRADTQAHVAPEPPKQAPKKQTPAASRVPSIIVGLLVVAVAGLSIWYLVRGEPLLVQGEVDATRLDIAARVDGRVAEIPVERGQNVAAGAVLVKIDNPETLAKNEQALAAKVVAEAQLANIKVGTRVEVIAARKAELERAQASVVLAQKTYDRVGSQLAEHGNAPIAHMARRTTVRFPRKPAQRGSGQIGPASRRSAAAHQRGARDRRHGGVKKAIARHRGRAIDHRADGGLRAGSLAGCANCLPSA